MEPGEILIKLSLTKPSPHYIILLSDNEIQTADSSPQPSCSECNVWIITTRIWAKNRQKLISNVEFSIPSYTSGTKWVFGIKNTALEVMADLVTGVLI